MGAPPWLVSHHLGRGTKPGGRPQPSLSSGTSGSPSRGRDRAGAILTGLQRDEGEGEGYLEAHAQAGAGGGEWRTGLDSLIRLSPVPWGRIPGPLGQDPQCPGAGELPVHVRGSGELVFSV